MYVYVTEGPATNAVSERSVSAMCQINTYPYLLTTMTEVRLNNLMVLHAHKHQSDGCS